MNCVIIRMHGATIKRNTSGCFGLMFLLIGSWPICWCISKWFANSDYCRHVCSFISLHGTTRFPEDGFLWSLILGIFKKICRNIPFSVKIWQKLHLAWRRMSIDEMFTI